MGLVRKTLVMQPMPSGPCLSRSQLPSLRKQSLTMLPASMIRSILVVGQKLRTQIYRRSRFSSAPGKVVPHVRRLHHKERRSNPLRVHKLGQYLFSSNTLTFKLLHYRIFATSSSIAAKLCKTYFSRCSIGGP